MSVGIYILIAAVAFLVLYFAIKKLTLQIDEKALLEPIKTSLYPEFCDFIDEKIGELKSQIEADLSLLKDENLRAEFLEKLGDLSRKLTFIQTMNLSKKNDEVWQNELFEFLKTLESVIETYLKDGEAKADELRITLMDKFKSLQEKQA
ncbi:hypothetical protein CQA38_04420 [Campylobacter sp. MIT 12-5580]|uniref:hypothetical protein n=1 Tax=Campylobacter sp. MIT 12-5580 TaxID=2040651 RepID=UPI0010F5A64D|nr:hypothetical protein [Campylobacter sp. MIT 12-5580]TKX29333.1 hypothetical protein CQA38_04420 [Campylobacter sp. MIT 12-5580]